MLKLENISQHVSINLLLVVFRTWKLQLPKKDTLKLEIQIDRYIYETLYLLKLTLLISMLYNIYITYKQLNI